MNLSKLNVLISDIIFTESIGQNYLPYVYGCLRAFVSLDEKIDNQIEWIEPIFLPTDIRINNLNFDQQIDVLALSLYVWNFEQQIKIAKQFRQRYPKGLIIVGGPSVPDKSSSFFIENPEIDICVHKEGEQAFYEILKHLVEGQELPNLFNITYKNPNGINFIENKKLKLNLLNIPSPYLKNYYQPLIEKLRENDSKKISAIWETNRGCPYSCAYCDWGSSTESKIRIYSIERLKKELEWFSLNQINEVWCADANIGLLARDLELINDLINFKKLYNFPKQFNGTYAKNTNDRVLEIHKKLQLSGLAYDGLTVSVQSLNENSLVAIKRENIGYKNYFDLVRKQNDKDNFAYADIIVGLPNETRQSFRQGFETLYQNGVDYFRIYPLLLLPNAELSKEVYRLKYGLKTIRRRLMLGKENNEHVELVVENNTMSVADWIEDMTYSSMLLMFHSSWLLRFVFLFFHKEYSVSFTRFYEKIINIDPKYKSIFKIRSILKDIFLDVTLNERSNYIGRTKFNSNLPFEFTEAEAMPFARGWISVIEDEENFYKDIKNFLLLEYEVDEETLDSLLFFQKQMLIKPDYNFKIGKNFNLKYNFLNYFFKNEPLYRKNAKVKISQTHVGISKYYQMNHNKNVNRYIDYSIGRAYSRAGFAIFNYSEMNVTNSLFGAENEV